MLMNDCVMHEGSNGDEKLQTNSVRNHHRIIIDNVDQKGGRQRSVSDNNIPGANPSAATTDEMKEPE